MGVFVDTSALYAALSASDCQHQAAGQIWTALSHDQEALFTSNYVVLETIALVGHRMGPQAVRDFQTRLVPLLRVHWVGESLHERAVSALMTAGDTLSLVDCVSFETMRLLGLDTALAFDAHFERQGFRCIP